MISLYINSTDASAIGVSLGDGALATLMTPAPNKSYLENKSEHRNGKEVVVSATSPALKDERSITLKLNIHGETEAEFLSNYKSLSVILDAGKVDLSTSFEPDVVYHLLYESCTQIQTYFKKVGILAVRFCEPNPSNRT